MTHHHIDIDLNEFTPNRPPRTFPLSSSHREHAMRVPAELAGGIARRLRLETIVSDDGDVLLKFRDSGRYLTPAGFADVSIRASLIRLEARNERRAS